MSSNLDDAIRSAVTSAAKSGEWHGITHEDKGVEGWLQFVDVDNSDIDYPEDIEDPSDFTIVISGNGEVVFKDGDGDEEKSEEDVRITARITVEVHSIGVDGTFQGSIAAKVLNVEIEG